MAIGQKPLTTVRAINDACWQAAMSSRGRPVYAEVAGDSAVKVTKARTVKGVLQVKTFSGWVNARRVWVKN